MASLTTLTYKALFNDPSNNPYGSGDEAKAGYAATYAHWRVEDNPPTPEAVQQETLVDFQWAIGAMGYFISTPGNPNGILHLGHGLYTHPGVAGRPSLIGGLLTVSSVTFMALTSKVMHWKSRSSRGHQKWG